jgi:peptidoglycan-N-acetylmuramic acid deacetylase
MRTKLFGTISVLILLVSLLASCVKPAVQVNSSERTSSSTSTANSQLVPETVNKTTQTAVDQNQPKCDACKTSTNSTKATDNVPVKNQTNDNNPLVKSISKTSLTKATVASRSPLSWYYLKKGKGNVPDFPKETKTFTSDQHAVWVGTGKKVYLTFDNGGPMGDTAKLLKTLKDNNVKATFFIAGYNLKAHPDFFRQLIADGHLVANHTMSHKDLTTLSDDQVKKEINGFEDLYKNVTGEVPQKFFRFPYGTYSDHLLSLVSEMGYTSVFWSTAMKDWVPRKNGAADSYNDIMSNLHDGNVILMHQGSGDNIDALDRIIKGIKQAGYEFALVNDLQPPTKS